MTGCSSDSYIYTYKGDTSIVTTEGTINTAVLAEQIARIDDEEYAPDPLRMPQWWSSQSAIVDTPDSPSGKGFKLADINKDNKMFSKKKPIQTGDKIKWTITAKKISENTLGNLSVYFNLFKADGSSAGTFYVSSNMPPSNTTESEYRTFSGTKTITTQNVSFCEVVIRNQGTTATDGGYLIHSLSVKRVPSNIDASDITSGTLAADRVPNLPASKITSGTFAAERIPNLPASKITSGTFAAERLPAATATTQGAVTLPTVLFEKQNTSMSGSVTLSESAAAFARLTICYRNSDGNYSSVDVYEPDGKTVMLLGGTFSEATSATNVYLQVKVVGIDGTLIDTVKGENYRTGSATIKNNAATTTVRTDAIAITKVLGWHY